LFIRRLTKRGLDRPIRLESTQREHTNLRWRVVLWLHARNQRLWTGDNQGNWVLCNPLL